MKKQMTALAALLMAAAAVTGVMADSIADLEGKTIGVQMGTTGDIYASDYEGDEAGTTVERFSKGAQSALR